MSNLTKIPDNSDLSDRFRNIGEQIQSFFDFAENNPDRAVPYFRQYLGNSSITNHPDLKE